MSPASVHPSRLNRVDTARISCVVLSGYMLFVAVENAATRLPIRGSVLRIILLQTSTETLAEAGALAVTSNRFSHVQT